MTEIKIKYVTRLKLMVAHTIALADPAVVNWVLIGYTLCEDLVHREPSKGRTVLFLFT